MIEERKKICAVCNGKNCQQRYYPLNDEEYKAISCTKDSLITIENLSKFMEISLRPECKERMLKEHPIEWWFNQLQRTSYPTMPVFSAYKYPYVGY